MPNRLRRLTTDIRLRRLRIMPGRIILRIIIRLRRLRRRITIITITTMVHGGP